VFLGEQTHPGNGRGGSGSKAECRRIGGVKGGNTMTAELLRAKLRNFPAANLTLRLLLAR
jgi:hypothetical protein